MRQYLRLIQRTRSRRRRASLRLVRRVLREDRGGEVLEYVLIAGLIVVGAISTIACVGDKVLARWNTVRDGV